MSIDYRDFRIGNSPAQGKASDPEESRDWWSRKDKELADAVSVTIGTMDRGQKARMTLLMSSARLYGGLPALGIPGYTWSRPAGSAVATDGRGRLSLNVVQSVIDTLTSKIAKNKPKPLFLTSGGNFKQQRKAKKLNRFCDGLFYENKAHDLGVMAFRNAAIDGDGLIHVFERHGRAAMELVPASELYVDELEGIYGTPRQMHRVMSLDRGVLDALTTKKRAVEDANPAPTPAGGTPNVADAVQVRESWHLPSAPDTKDGRHAITIAGETLTSEPWTHDWFPFARLQWCPRQYGYWSQGSAERLMGIQLEINKLLWAASEAYRLAALSVMFVEKGSKVNKSHLTNLPGTIVDYTGTPPQYATPPVLPPEVYRYILQLVQWAYEMEGVSQLSASSQKPAGLDSGKALREYNDIESDRFMTIGHAYEGFFLDLAKKSIAVARDIAERDGGYAVKVPSGNTSKSEDWKEIDLDEDEYVMQCFPVSSLPNEPAGRFQTIQEWVQAGWYTPRQGKKLMNFPDIEAVDSLSQAAEDWLTSILDKIVDDEEYTAPEPFDDLELAYELALEYYQHGKINQLEESRLDMLRRFLDQVDAFKRQAQEQQMAEAAAMAPPGGAAGKPQAVPEAPPTSDILPNAPGVAA